MTLTRSNSRARPAQAWRRKKPNDKHCQTSSNSSYGGVKTRFSGFLMPITYGGSGDFDMQGTLVPSPRSFHRHMSVRLRSVVGVPHDIDLMEMRVIVNTRGNFHCTICLIGKGDFGSPLGTVERLPRTNRHARDTYVDAVRNGTLSMGDIKRLT